MGIVQKLNNAIVVDEDTISEIWWCLNRLSDHEVLALPLEDFEEIQTLCRALSRNVALKMRLQECQLSQNVISADRYSLEDFNNQALGDKHE